jgi:branched-chain amino acid transport system permease protein
VTAAVKRLGLLAAVTFAVPFVITDGYGRFLAILALLYAMLAVSWNLTLGFAGVFNFAHLAFFAIGAYATAIATVRWELSPWIGLLLAIVAAVVASAVAFVPVLRLKGIYVGLVTFVFARLCYFLVLNRSDVTGGSSGIVGLPQLGIGDRLFITDNRFGYYVVAAIAFLAAMAVMELTVHSRYGRSLVALRDNELYAVSRGLPAFRQRLVAFALSGAVAGLAGGLYALVIGVASPELFDFGFITLVLSMVFLGGVRTLYGPVVGAVAITLLSDQLKDRGAWRDIVIAGVILVVLWFFPGGLSGLLDGLRGRMPRARAGNRTAPALGKTK